MKTKIFLSLLMMNTTSFAETNWDLLIQNAPDAKSQHIQIEKGYVEMNVVTLPNDKIRFDGFTVLANKEKAKLVIHSNKKTLKDICNDYAELGRAFKAELVFNTNPIGGVFNFQTPDGRLHSSLEFENRFDFVKTEVSGLSSMDKSPWMDASRDSYGIKDLSKYYSEFMNKGMSVGQDNKVLINLSSQNGLACDIASGFIKPVISKIVSFEKALPSSSFWIDQKTFNDLSTVFNEEFAKTQSIENSTDQKLNEGILLGWSLAQVNSNAKDATLKNLDRGPRLLKSLKSKMETDSLDNSWKQTFEFTKPQSTLATLRMPMNSGDVFVVISE